MRLRAAGAVPRVLVAALVAIFASSLFYDSFFEDPTMWLLAGFLAGASMAAAGGAAKRRAREPGHDRDRAAFVLVPGVGATLAAYPPGRVGPVTRLALAFGLGYAVVGITAVVLVIAHVLHPATFLGGLAIVTGALCVAGLRRGGVRAHLAALAADIADDRFGLALGALVFVAIAIVRLRSSPLLNFEMFGPGATGPMGSRSPTRAGCPHTPCSGARPGRPPSARWC